MFDIEEFIEGERMNWNWVWMKFEMWEVRELKNKQP